MINIITKKGKKTDVLKPDVSIKAGYGEFETYNLLASINGGAGNIIGCNFSASKQETDGYLRNNFQETDAFNGHLTFYLPREATFSIDARYSDVHYSLPVTNDPSQPDYDPDCPVFIKDADQLRHFPSLQPSGTQDPQWLKHATYLDGILQVPVGPGTIKIHGFLTSGRRWLDFYNPKGIFIKNMF